MFRYRLVRVLIAGLIVATPFAVTTPAKAAGFKYFIGVSGSEPRCKDAWYEACLYWGGSIKNAFWPANDSWSDLSDHYFWSGTGVGEGMNVMNGAGAMFCGIPSECRSYYYADYNGNYDYENSYEVGALHYTSGHSGSIKIIL
ncbi:hypothetical protein GCM10029978_064860 [Actinoallomurus acanthiterrae]